MEARGKGVCMLTKPDNKKRKSDAKKELKENLKAFLMYLVSAVGYMYER